jgi:hypothetical protein
LGAFVVFLVSSCKIDATEVYACGWKLMWDDAIDE